MKSDRHIFLTGRPGSGKTTALARLAERLKQRGYRIGGILTREIRQGGRRMGFEVEDLATGTRWIMARRGATTPIRVGAYGVDPEALEAAAAAIERAIAGADVILIDEVGPMELASPAFRRALEAALASGKPVIGTVHYRSQHPLARRIRQQARIITLTPENRGRVPAAITDMLEPLLSG